MIGFLRRLIQHYGFFKRDDPVEMAAFHESMRNWHSAPFYTEESAGTNASLKSPVNVTR